MKDEIKTKLEDITQRQLMIMNDVYAICRHVDHNPDDMTEKELDKLSAVYEKAEAAHETLVDLRKKL